MLFRSEYYKLPIIGVIAGIILIMYIIKQIMTPEKTNLMDLTVVNTNPDVVSETTYFTDFLQGQGFDPEKDEIAVNSNLSLSIDEDGMPSDPTSLEVLYTLFAADAVDTFIADESIVQVMANNDMFAPLDEVVSEEFLEKYEDSLIYSTDSETKEKYPVAILLPEEGGIMDTGMFLSTPIAVGFTGSDTDRSLETEFLEYLLSY